jgi:histidine ammonia-lyase
LALRKRTFQRHSSSAENLVLSHAVGVGAAARAVVRLTLALKIATLARGYSGVRRVLVDALSSSTTPTCCRAFRRRARWAPAATSRRSRTCRRVVRRGRSRVRAGHERRRGPEARRLTRIKLAAKEGLALLNGTQISTALALVNLFAIDNLYATALVAGALSVDAAEGSASPFDARIHELRGHPGRSPRPRRIASC